MIRLLGIAMLASLACIGVCDAEMISLPGSLHYIYDANLGEDGPMLDGSWMHDNGSDEWDETAPGAGAPGGAFVERESIGFLERPEVLTIVDPGDPRDDGFSDPSNRKLYFSRAIPTLDFATGAFVLARWRMDPDPPEGPSSSSYALHDDKGQINLGTGSRSVSLSYQAEDKLAVKLGGSDSFELIDIDSSHDFHTALATMTENGDGTFAVDVWVDGTPSFSVASADLNGNSEIPLGGGISMGVGSTGQAGTIQVDFIGAGVVPEPSSAALFSIAFGAALMTARRRR